MADGTTLFADAEASVQRAVMAAMRADEDVRDVFGTPPRIYDDETESPAYPFARLERHETRPAGSACVAGTEHTLSFSVTSRFGGRVYAKEAIGALRAAMERAEITPERQTIIMVLPTYGDVFRTNDRKAFRGIFRLRIISEEAA